MFEPSDIHLPPNVGRVSAGASALHGQHASGQLAKIFTKPEQWKSSWAAYLGGCALADEAVGIILDAARGRSDWDRTLVIFHPDHGEQLGAHNCYQKMVCYEDSIHLPMIIRDPHAPAAGQRCSALTSHIDIAPTILDFAGIPIPDSIQGRSLRQLISKPDGPWRRAAVFSEYNGNVGWNYYQRCVVTDQWKYIDNIGVDQELYNLRDDPYEMQNVIDTAPKNLVRKLRDRLHQWMHQTGDFLD